MVINVDTLPSETFKLFKVSNFSTTSNSVKFVFSLFFSILIKILLN